MVRQWFSMSFCSVGTRRQLTDFQEIRGERFDRHLLNTSGCGEAEEIPGAPRTKPKHLYYSNEDAFKDRSPLTEHKPECRLVPKDRHGDFVT
jgi:hypothetical protein